MKANAAAVTCCAIKLSDIVTACYLTWVAFLEGLMHDGSLVDMLGALLTQALQLKLKVYCISTLHWLTECKIRKSGLRSLPMS